MKQDKKISSLSQDILEMINSKKIKPEPKWKFILWDYFIWAMSILSILVGSLAFSVIIYMLENSDWDIYENINDSLFKFILVTLPYFWIIFLVIFVFVADYNLKHTKRGYKYRVHYLIISSIALSMLFGFFMYNMGVGRAVDNTIAERIPLYGNSINKMHQRGMIWHRPSEGFLAGVIVKIGDNNNFIIHDINDMVWHIDASSAKILFHEVPTVEQGVRIFGEDTSALNDLDGYFRAIKVLPLPKRSWLQQGGRIRHDLHKLLLSPEALERLGERFNKNKHDIDEEEMQGIGKSCTKEADCKTPFSFLIKANCSYRSKCVDGQCKVVCLIPYKDNQKDLEKSVQCEENIDCNCNEFLRGEFAECICHNKRCAAVVAE